MVSFLVQKYKNMLYMGVHLLHYDQNRPVYG